MQGDIDGCVSSAGVVVTRSLLLAVGMAAAGQRKGLVRKALAGSLAVQTFVWLWSAGNLIDGEPATLPSSAAVLSGNPLSIVYTYLARALMVGGGMYLAGERDNLTRNALAGTAAIEISVMTWAASKQTTAGIPAASIVPSPQLSHAQPPLTSLVRVAQ